MSSRSPPAVPPRPARSPNSASGPPKIPPRPSRRPGRSSPPKSDSYAPSPLNDPPRPADQNRTGTEANVNVPSTGEEGREYESLGYKDKGEENGRQSQVQEPAETRSVNHDLYLHAPKPSLPSSSAKQQVRAVTSTTAQQAAAVGIGTSVSPELTESDRSYARASSNRPRDNPDQEHGIPEIGQRAPLDPNAGDVQAPTPQHGELEVSHEARGHSRTGSYGLLGHGVQPTDKLEKAWYEKHPEDLVREGGPGARLSSPRPEGAMNSDELNKMVQSSGDKGTGLGTSSEFLGTPEEEVGNIATEELATRLSTPPVGSHLRDTSKSHPSPLHQMSFPETVPAKDGASEEEEPAGGSGQEEVKIHVSEPLHHPDHPDGFAPGEHDQGVTEEGEENLDETPILAADEAVPGTEHMEPAVSSKFERPPSTAEPERQKQPESPPGSRQGHKPRSPTRLGSGREKHDEDRLEGVEELEPLFPVDSKEGQPPEDRLKRQSLHHQHRFPSKDVWEDAPESLQLETTVTTPDVPRRPKGEDISGALKEDIDFNKLVKQKSTDVMPSYLPETKPADESKQRFPNRDICEDTPENLQLKTTVQELEQEKQEEQVTSREVEKKPSIPSIPPRPSKSTASPSPERVEAVCEPEKQEEKVTSPDVERKPSIPIIPSRPSRSTASPSPPESVQARVTSSTMEPRKPPAIPERPKPQVPARPSRPKSRGPNATPTKTTSAGSTESMAEAPKPKPEVPTRPARPASNKIASLQAGFLSDLNNRLKLGPKPPPQQEKEEEPEKPVQKGPLSDARKGRARGPARRKPAATQAALKPIQPDAPATPMITLVDAWSAWHIGGDGVLVVGENAPKSPEKASEKPTDEVPIAVAAAEILERQKAAEKAPEKTEEAPEPVQLDISKEEPKEEASHPRIVDGTQVPAYPTPSPKTVPPPLLSNVDIPNDFSLEAKAQPESEPEPAVAPDVKAEPKAEAKPEPEPEPQLESEPESGTELEPKVMSEPESRPEPLPIAEAKVEEEPQEKPPSEEEMIAPPSPQEAVRKASQVIAEEGLGPRKSLVTEEKAAQMFP